MIAPPNISEINCAFQEAKVIYAPIPNINPKILLVPHAGIHESRVVTAATLSYLSNPSGEIILLGTNHRNIRFPSDIYFIKDNNFEHSLTINEAFLKYLNRPYSSALLNDDANINLVVTSLVNWLNSNTNNTLIVSSDLSHYNNNQEQDNINEDLLIQGLINSSIDIVNSGLEYVTACGKIVLKVATQVANFLQLKGKVTCYNDSKNKRFGWSTSNNSPEVSYLGMVWVNQNINQNTNVNLNNIISNFDQQHLVAFAKSCVIATLMSSRIPTMPSWSIWNKINNGVFVGIKDIDGNVRASIGHYESSNKSSVDNVKESSIKTIEDAAVRWKAPLSIVDIIHSKYIFYVNILEDKSKWKEYIPKDLINNISPEDNYGFYLKLGQLEATYLPSVWTQLKHLTFEDLMIELTRKAGGSGQEWRSNLAVIKLYRTQYIELLILRIC